ncbi:MAG TPA: PAS domain-containing protein, partial [Myxococcales bacterium]|nr:PAS domain-containing protein [Myxococcales bacterium]
MASIQPLVHSQELRAVIDSVNDYAIFLLDPDGQIMTWNRGAQLIKGYAPHEIIGQSYKRFYPPEDVAAGKPDRLLQTAFREGRVEDEGYRVRKDGTRFWADVVISAVRDENGDLRGYVKVTRDLTARRMAEEELRQSEERLRLMIESVKDYAIFMLTPDGHVATWNPGAERLKGYTAREIIGQHFSRFYPPEDLAAGKPARELEIAAATGKFEEESIRVRKDGTRFWAGVVLSAVHNAKGELVGYAKVTRDLTSRKRASEEMEQRRRQQAAVAELGLYAVQTPQVPALLERAVQTARDTLGIDDIAVVGGDDPSDPAAVRVPIHAADRQATPYGFLHVAEGHALSAGDIS